MASKTPREVQRKVLSFDGGSYSIKYVSSDKSGAFLSVTAPVTNDTLAGFNALTDVNSYDLTIIETPGQAQGRWIVGDQAQGRRDVMRYTRNIRRFDDQIFHVFMCGALRAAFPSHHLGEEKLAELARRRNKIDGRWRVPVSIIGSIAPGYYANAGDLAQALKGYYDFVDNVTGAVYSFCVESTMIVPEGFGAYATQLYEVKEGRIEKRKSGAFAKSTIAVFDIGGRSFDVLTWKNGKPVESKITSEDEGIILTVTKIVEEILATHERAFPNKPNPLTVIDAIANRKNGAVNLVGAMGKKIDVTEIVDRRMNMLASRAWEIYQNSLESGQEIDGLMFAGGGGFLSKPYIEKNFRHEREYMAGKTLRDMYMANARGAYMYFARKQEEQQ